MGQDSIKQKIPQPPPGFVLDETPASSAPPPGFVLDQAAPPPERTEPQKQGFFGAVGEDVLGVIKSLPSIVHMVMDPTFAAETAIQQGAQIGQGLQRDKELGYGPVARTLHTAGRLAGINVDAMTKAAERGDTAAIFGHTVLPMAFAASPLFRGALGKIPGELGEIGNRMSLRAGQSIVGASPKNLPPVSEPAPAMVAEGITAFSERGLAKNIGQRISERNATVRNTLEKYENQPREPLQPIVDRAVGPMIEDAEKAGLPTKAEAIRKWRENFLSNQPEELTLKQLYNVRRDLTKSAGLFKKSAANPEEVSIGNAMENAYRSMNDALDERIPGIKKYTQRESGLLRGQEMIENKLRIAAGKPLLPRIREYLGGGEGDIYGGVSVHLNPPGGILPKTLLMKGLGKRVPLPELPLPPEIKELPPPLGNPSSGPIGKVETPPAITFREMEARSRVLNSDVLSELYRRAKTADQKRAILERAMNQ